MADQNQAGIQFSPVEPAPAQTPSLVWDTSSQFEASSNGGTYTADYQNHDNFQLTAANHHLDATSDTTAHGVMSGLTHFDLTGGTHNHLAIDGPQGGAQIQHLNAHPEHFSAPHIEHSPFHSNFSHVDHHHGHSYDSGGSHSHDHGGSHSDHGHGHGSSDPAH